MSNAYFDLTREFNAREPVAVLTSGQAAVWYRIAIMSKDGDWVLRETPEACARVLEVLEGRGARYRPGAPLDVRWLSGGWSSHLEFRDERGRRVRCDFLSRPPRLSADEVASLFCNSAGSDELRVIDLEGLIRMKRTERAKDHVVIGELARLLPPDREILFTTDPDRIIDLALGTASGGDRQPVRVARGGGSREEVVVAVARETFRFQERDRLRLAEYREAAREFAREAARLGPARLDLPRGHDRLLELAERLLPEQVGTDGGEDPCSS